MRLAPSCFIHQFRHTTAPGNRSELEKWSSFLPVLRNCALIGTEEESVWVLLRSRLSSFAFPLSLVHSPGPASFRQYAIFQDPLPLPTGRQQHLQSSSLCSSATVSWQDWANSVRSGGLGVAVSGTVNGKLHHGEGE